MISLPHRPRPLQGARCRVHPSGSPGGWAPLHKLMKAVQTLPRGNDSHARTILLQFLGFTDLGENVTAAKQLSDHQYVLKSKKSFVNLSPKEKAGGRAAVTPDPSLRPAPQLPARGLNSATGFTASLLSSSPVSPLIKGFFL